MKKNAIYNKVSRIFYAGLCQRISDAFTTILGDEAAVVRLIGLVDSYILDGSEPAASTDSNLLLGFALLRSEIDKALLRSAAARRRAKERRREVGSEKTADKAPEAAKIADTFRQSMPEADQPQLTRSQRRNQKRRERRKRIRQKKMSKNFTL